MIAVVNPNVGLDYMLFFQNFQRGSTLRAEKAKWGLGGKGLVAAYILADLGFPVWITGFSGGLVGSAVEEILWTKGIETDFVRTQGEARINVVLTDRAQNWQSTIIAPGVVVDHRDEKTLITKCRRRLDGASCLVLGGSLPTGCSLGLYRELIGMAHEKRVPCVLDTSGAPLREALEARPTAIKPNQAEAEDLLGRRIPDKESAIEAVEELGFRGVPWVVITLGARGLVARDGDNLWYAPPPPLVPKNTAGAGDAIVAGIALGLARGLDLGESLKWGLALAAVLMEKDTVLECDFTKASNWREKIELVTLGG